MNLKNFLNKDASNISIPLLKELHGVKIRKLPNGAYIKALNTMQNLPKVLMEACFPGVEADDIFDEIQGLNKDELLLLAGKCIQVIPEQFLKVVSNLLDIPFEKLMNELTPNETLEILEAYWQMNDLSDFFNRLKGMVMKSKTAQELMKSSKSVTFAEKSSPAAVNIAQTNVRKKV